MSSVRHLRVALSIAAIIGAALGCETRGAEPLAVGTLERDRLELIAEQQETIVALHVREGDSSGVEAKPKCLRRIMSVAVLVADEALLLSESDDFAIFDDRCGGIRGICIQADEESPGFVSFLNRQVSLATQNSARRKLRAKGSRVKTSTVSCSILPQMAAQRVCPPQRDKAQMSQVEFRGVSSPRKM